MATRQPTAKAGKKLGRYRIIRELGRGGMGVVYVAQDENLDRLVALKTTSVAGLGSGEKTRNQRRQRFIREVQALAQLSHENVVHVYDAGEEDDPDLGWLLFYSMQYVEGITLAQLVQRQGALDAGAAAAVCMQVASGLGAAHRQGIVHRDVKPANIFLSVDGRALIGDFGIAKIEGSTQITRRDQLVGTPNYLAPEQILGQNVSPATDVFALAALFYVIVTNRPLRTRLDAAALLEEAKGSLSKEKMLKERNVPEGLRRVLARALEREPSQRYADGAAFAEALSEHATRIPPLRNDLAEERALARDDAASFDTNPFASLHGEGPSDTGEPRSFGGVEEAAQALLAEVDQLSRRPDASLGAPPPASALPVVESESTMVFNLRAWEGGRSAGATVPGMVPLTPDAPEEPLPVARSESTVVFNLHSGARGGQDPSTTAGATAPFLSIQMGEEPVTATSFSEEQQDSSVAQPALRSVPVAGPPEGAADAPAAIEGRHIVRVTLSAAAGALFAALALVAFHFVIRGRTPDIPRPDPGDSPAAFMGSELERIGAANLPEHCSKTPAAADDKARARELVQRALAIEGDKPSEARRLLEEAIRRDASDVEAHYHLGKVRAAMQDFAGSKAEYRCVIWLDPSSPLAATALKAFETR